jgi:pyrroloquinoline quinone (PQQ) biosynthesis protein C
MTAVQWLIEQLEERGHIIPDHIEETSLIKEKQQITDAWIATDNELQRMAAEKYYNENYGIKGSDNSPKEIKKDSFGKIRFTEEEWAELNNGSKGSDEHIEDNLEEILTSSQTEISDEEIEKAVMDSMDYVYLNPNDSLIFHQGWMRAIKWYREQLKQL